MEALKAKRILVTGASGFVGTRFLEYNNACVITPVSLRNDAWKAMQFNGYDVAVHLAGKAHEMQKIDDQIYFDVNSTLTASFFEKVKTEGIRHFIYISSTKVYGDGEFPNLNEKSPCNPVDPYGKSKLAAEQFLRGQSGVVVSIVRPPVIYGPGVKGNILRLMQLAARHYPLPFGNIQNARSMVFVDNLIELINTIIVREESGVFIAGDSTPLSTTQLVTLMRRSFGSDPKLLSIPMFLRKIIQKIRPALYVRLFGSFVVDNSNTNKQLHFTPPYTTAYGIEQLVNWYKSIIKQKK